MKRSLWAALGVVAVALAVPAMALAGHHRDLRHHGHHHFGGTGATGWSGPTGAGATVASYSDGVLTLTLPNGTLTGNVGDHTHFVCLGRGYSHGHRFSHKRRTKLGHGDPGYGRGHSHSYTPPPPCDSSLLVPGAPLQSAGVLVVPGGVQFSLIVLLPAVQ